MFDSYALPLLTNIRQSLNIFPGGKTPSYFLCH